MFHVKRDVGRFDSALCASLNDRELMNTPPTRPLSERSESKRGTDVDTCFT